LPYVFSEALLLLLVRAVKIPDWSHHKKILKKQAMAKENLFTIPNYFTFYRFFSAPLIIWFIVSGKETLFVVFIIINLVTDALDGILARKLNQHTDFGARMDSIADKVTYALAFSGLLVFKMAEIQPYLFSLFTFIFLGVIALLHSFIKFGKMSMLHTYATKIGGYLQGAFFFALFFFGFSPVFYYIMISWAILSVIEMIAIQMIIPEMKPNIKGLYWVLKNRKS